MISIREIAKLQRSDRISIEESNTVIEYKAIRTFEKVAGCRHLYNVRPFHENQTRFAPSRQVICVGGAYYYLFWLFACAAVRFVLRIEDTDLERSTPEAT